MRAITTQRFGAFEHRYDIRNHEQNGEDGDIEVHDEDDNEMDNDDFTVMSNLAHRL